MGRKKVKTAEMASKIVTQPDAVENKNSDEKMTVLEGKLDKLVQTVGLLQENMQKQNDRMQIRDISPVPSAHSSMKEASESAQHLPSFEELRSDGKIQAELQKRLHHYDNMSRTEVKGRQFDAQLKSGRYRTGIHKVRKVVNWPQDYCTVPGAQKQPTYDELSVYQWSQGFVQCILEEQSSKVKENMMKYFVSIMQDAIELSFATAKRAHGIVLQEMEKGSVDWQKLGKIELIRSIKTQRLVPSTVNGRASADSSEKVVPGKLYNKGTCRYEKQTEHTDKGTTYGHYCSHCIVVTGKKYEHPRNQCLRLKNEKKEGGTSQRV